MTPRMLRRSLILMVATVALFLLNGCASAGPQPTSTPELAVVVFATEEKAAGEPPTPAAPVPTVSATLEAVEPTKAAATPIAYQLPPNANPLTGLPVDDPLRLNRRPIMVRIGNDPGARPQVAISEADIVYEEIIEWYTTRFTAIYFSTDPETIAPVRSARLINLQLGPQYQGALANSGGSDEVRWQISQSDIINLDEFFVPGPYFYRPNEGWQTRLAFNAQNARDYLDAEGLDIKVNLRGFAFSETLEMNNLPQVYISAASEIAIPYPQTTAATHWVYDSASGKYLKYTLGQPFKDYNGPQVSASNVIIYFADHQETDIVEDSLGATSIRIMVSGFGPAWLARDGKLLKGNWATDGQETPEFFFADFSPMPLKPGNTWVQVVPLDFEIEINGEKESVGGSAEAEGSQSETDSTENSDADQAPAEPSPTPIGARSGSG